MSHGASHPHLSPELHPEVPRPFSDLSLGLPSWLSGEGSAYSAGDRGSVLGLEDLLEEGMAMRSSVLAWSIPWTEEPGGLHGVHGVHGVAKSLPRLSNKTTIQLVLPQ